MLKNGLMTEEDKTLYKKLGLLIKEKRKEKRFSQSNIAEQMNLSYQQIQKYERGLNKIHINHIIKLSKILDYDFLNALSNDQLDIKPSSNIDYQIMDKLNNLPKDIKIKFLNLIRSF